jgi:hypothetical protein
VDDREERWRSGELLQVLPPTAPGGVLSGHRAGRSARLVFGLLLTAAVGLAVWIATRPVPRPQPRPYVFDAAAPRADAVVWGSGRGVLGMQRAPGSVQEIHLPDRVLRLAPGCDFARVAVDVVEGETRTIEVQVGSIREVPLGGAAPLLDPRATAR